jgi:hypothetical protein
MNQRFTTEDFAKHHPEIAALFTKSTEQENDKAIADAAGAVAGAIATAYLGPGGVVVGELVASIAEALLAEDDNKFEKEIIERLTRIEAKLDSVLNYFNNQLPEIVKTLLTQQYIKELVDKLNNDRIRVKNAMRRFESKENPTEADANTLAERGDEVLATSLTLVKMGVERYLMAVHAFSLAIPAFNLAIKVDRSHELTLSGWAEEYLPIVSNWLKEGNQDILSLTDLLASYAGRLAKYQPMVKDLVSYQPVRYLTGVFKSNPWMAGVGTDYHLSEAHVLSWGYRLDQAISVNVGDADHYTDYSVFGISVHPDFPPMVGPPDMRNWDSYWQYYGRVANELQIAATFMKTAEEKIVALRHAIEVLEPLQKALGYLVAISK